ncbi:MAG: hypothetical protein IKD34_08320, partial [Oscillospiraceae bacterium]|nr:hypothetical protein [Oscillospiraceae bacterium]
NEEKMDPSFDDRRSHPVEPLRFVRAPHPFGRSGPAGTGAGSDSVAGEGCLFGQALAGPGFVSVEKVGAQRVYYTVRYFPFGAVGMSYGEADGYNIEKPLTRW